MEHFVASDGEHIHVNVSGTGPALVLLHEWASNHRIWTPLMADLELRFTVYRWDARGHGGHPRHGAETASVGRMAQDLAELLDHFRLEAPVLVGHSMGALTAWDYIARHGVAGIAKLVVIDQSPKLVTDDGWRYGVYYDWTPERNAAFVEGLRTDFVETVVRLVAFGRNPEARRRYESGRDGLWRLRAYLTSVDPEPLISIWQSLVAADYRPVLPKIVRPALLVYGTESNFYGVETGEYVLGAMPDARLIIYDGADHSPHVAQPARFVADLTAFALGCAN